MQNKTRQYYKTGELQNTHARKVAFWQENVI